MKNTLQKAFKKFGYELHRSRGRGTMGGALEHLRDRGFQFDHIIDGGASDGRWTKLAQHYFPHARYTLVEPLAEYTDMLAKIPGCEVVSAALANNAGTMELHINGPFNSSLEPRPGEKRSIPTVTLDSLLKNPSRTLVKLDLEEAEYQVLSTSSRLGEVAAVLVECSFRNLPKYCALMEEKGFAVFYILDLNYRKNGDMFQVDILFVPKKNASV